MIPPPLLRRFYCLDDYYMCISASANLLPTYAITMDSFLSNKHNNNHKLSEKCIFEDPNLSKAEMSLAGNEYPEYEKIL